MDSKVCSRSRTSVFAQQAASGNFRILSGIRSAGSILAFSELGCRRLKMAIVCCRRMLNETCETCNERLFVEGLH